MKAKRTFTRSIETINKKLACGEAVVMTADELFLRNQSGRKVRFREVDIVTTATCGLMSGTYAVLSFKVSEPNSFVKAQQCLLNGVDCYPGPCPNERLGMIDCILKANDHSRYRRNYGGGNLLFDLVSGKEVDVEVTTDEGEQIRSKVTLDQIPYAVLYATRHAFRNYVGFLNSGPEPIETIFCSMPLPPNLEGATVVGCGAINPIQNDPQLKTIGVGTRVMLNGGVGYVTGKGTRSTAERPNLTVFGDLHAMKADFMGGFRTSLGPETIQTWAVPIPILNKEILEAVSVTDSDVPLVMSEVRGRHPVAEVTYADVWENTAQAISFDEIVCRRNRKNCQGCPPAEKCPTGAFTEKKDGINTKICYHCGLCSIVCWGGCFKGDLGRLNINGRIVPIVQRMSNRLTASLAMGELKKKLRNRQFTLTAPLEKITWD